MKFDVLLYIQGGKTVPKGIFTNRHKVSRDKLRTPPSSSVQIVP